MQEVPPLIPVLANRRSYIKWSKLADLPVPIHSGCIAVHNHKVYVTGYSSDKVAIHQIYVYDISTGQWDQLPPSGHFNGVPHIIGEKLAIVGGCLCGNSNITNEVLTFDEDSQTWMSYYPNLLSARSKPGVVSHLEHVIVAGGMAAGKNVQDDIEVLNWRENSRWRRVSIKLPVPMFFFTPTISDDHMLIVGYSGADRKSKTDAYKLPVASIIASNGQGYGKLTKATHFYTALVPSSSPPVVVGGWNQSEKTPTPDIMMYNSSDNSWQKIGSLPSPRCFVTVALVHKNSAVIVIGGCTRGDNKVNRDSSSLKVVELGRAESIPD